MSIYGVLTKITIQKKLMVKVDQQTYKKINASIKSLAKKHSFKDYKQPCFTLENDDSSLAYFINVSLDKYDIRNLVKFERLLKSNVFILGAAKSYCFTPDESDEEKRGINFVLTKIAKTKVQPKKDDDDFDLTKDEVAEIGAEVEAEIEARNNIPLDPEYKAIGDAITTPIIEARFGKSRRSVSRASESEMERRIKELDDAADE